MPPAHDPSARGLDSRAVGATLRRLARADAPPWLHAEVARRMADKLAVIRYQPERVLDWWSRLGAGDEPLARAYPTAQRVCVEPDETWVERSVQAQRRPWWSPAGWGAPRVQVVAQGAQLPSGVGLVWANMMLHAVVDPVELFERWHDLLRLDGFVMFSCLGPGTLRELRTLYDACGWPTPTPGYVDMHDLGDMLVQCGFADPVMDQETLTLQWRDPVALLRELRTLGGNAHPGRGAGLRTPRWQARLERALQGMAAPDGTISLSFEVAYGHAFKAAPRMRPGQTATVSLQDMRTMVGSGQRARK